MSEDKKSSSDRDKYYFSAGVFKIDQLSGGYPDLKRIVDDWAKDENFYELIIRKVSEENYGIQFVYFTDQIDPNLPRPMKAYKKELERRFGKGFYAWDYNESTEDKLERIPQYLIVSKKLELPK
jgi:hypothetical protein